MLKHGNSKLGDVWTFSLPAEESCPGESEVCGEVCYAKSGFYRMPSVKISESRAMAVSKTPGFTKMVSDFIKRFGIKLVRIHASGDFYSPGYVRKWHSIISQNSGTTFYAYTRSWRPDSVTGVKGLRFSVRLLTKLSNMTLWLSCDKSTGTPPSWVGCPWAYLATDDEDSPNYIPSLVFRNKVSTVLRRQPGTDALVCPLEQGVDLPLTTCGSCRICFNWEGKVLKNLIA
jgi:hypothetical protein